ncbi:Hypothetical protein PBC10988_29310 [Planctomycetales bacterium 10988]|nr:Hypothetical protein PBC10988_29310 [Planctomycetales bacterium 10988]
MASLSEPLSKGIQAAKSGNKILARLHLNQAKDQTPENPFVWHWLAWVAESPAVALEYLDRGLKLAPRSAILQSGRQWVFHLQSEHQAGLLEAIPEAATERVAEAPIQQKSTEKPPTRTAEEAKSAASVEAAISEVRSGDKLKETSGAEDSWDLPPGAFDEDSYDTEAYLDLMNDNFDGELGEEDSLMSSDDLLGELVEETSEPTDEKVEETTTVVTSESAATITPAKKLEETFGISPDRFPLTDDFTDLEPTTCEQSAAGRLVWSPAEAAKTASLLVVDDSATIRKLVELTFEKLDFEVFSAVDGVQAIATIGKRRPDLVLLDINMPRMDGYKVCKVIRTHEATKDIPVVMLSGKDGLFDKVRGRLAGCTDYITKPFHAETVIEVVQQYLNQKAPVVASR